MLAEIVSTRDSHLLFLSPKGRTHRGKVSKAFLRKSNRSRIEYAQLVTILDSLCNALELSFSYGGYDRRSLCWRIQISKPGFHCLLKRNQLDGITVYCARKTAKNKWKRYQRYFPPNSEHSQIADFIRAKSSEVVLA
jgi:hypothetical protein